MNRRYPFLPFFIGIGVLVALMMWTNAFDV